MLIKSGSATPVRDQETPPIQYQRVTSDHHGDSANSEDFASTPPDALREMLKDSRNELRQILRSLNDLQGGHEVLQKGRQELIRDHQQQRQRLQEARRNCHDLRNEHQILRKENSEQSAVIEELRQQLEHLRQELRQPKREPREPNGDYRQLMRDHQALRTEHQDLQCKENELQQDLAYAEFKLKALEQELNSVHVMTEAETQTFALDFFQSRYNHIVNMVLKPFATTRGFEYNDANDRLMDLVLRPLYEDALEASELRRQVSEILSQLQKSQTEASSLRSHVQELQKEMLARIEKVQAISDEHFAQDFRSLGAHVKSLSRSARLNLGADMLQSLGSGSLLSNTSEHHWKIRANQKYYIEAWIWGVLLDSIFGSAFSMYGKSGSSWSSSWNALFGIGQIGAWPRPTASSESFRCTVADQLVTLIGRDTIVRGQADTQGRAGSVARRGVAATLECRGEVANTMGTKLTSISSTVGVSEISNIIDRAFALALDMSLQKCRLRSSFPVSERPSTIAV